MNLAFTINYNDHESWDLMFTTRLRIRRFNEADLAAVFDYLSDEDVVKYEPYAAMTKEECQKMLAKMTASEDFWAVCLKETNQPIGQVYLALREQKTWELGYVFNKNYQKQGFATEAAQALLTYAFEECMGHRITANCNPENQASWKLLERLSFRREGHLKQNIYFKTDANGQPIWQDTFEYGLLASEYTSK